MNVIRLEAVKDDDREHWIATDEDNLYDMVDEKLELLISGEIDSFSVVNEEE
jgi:hypothetical protein